MAELVTVNTGLPPERPLTKKIVTIWKKGGLVGLPTDTIYGILALYSLENAERLAAVRGRQDDKPFLVVIPDLSWLSQLVSSQFLQQSRTTRFWEKFWPGANTLILPKKEGIPYPEGESIALRLPAERPNVFFHQLLQTAGRPLLAPSLNRPGKEPLSKPAEIEQEFGGALDLVCYDPTFDSGEPSAIWDLTKKEPVRIR